MSAAVGDFGLGALVGQRFRLPVPLLCGPTEILRDKQLIARLPLSHQRYRAGLRLPLPTDGVILLLTPELPEGWLPLTEIFQPVMANLAKAVLLCRNSDAYTQFLESDRDQARAELARQLRMADKERYFCAPLRRHAGFGLAEGRTRRLSGLQQGVRGLMRRQQTADRRQDR